MNNPIAPLKTDVPETEELLIDTAQQAVNQCRWVVGECAAKWTKKYAKGRTDADFAALINLSGDQVFQRRRVWESFADVHESYPKLKWSHFYSAINWDDAAECLQWAEETQATVAEMKARDLQDVVVERAVLELMETSEHIKRIQIVNGLERGNITRALDGENVGTVITSD